METSQAAVFELSLTRFKNSADLHQLQDVEGVGEEQQVVPGGQTSVPRPDGGKHAWLFLAGCFVFEALIWGFPFSFGVFQKYYTSHAPFDQHPGNIAIVGTCSTGIMYFFAPVSLFVLETWPSMCLVSSVSGLIVVVSALIASSFSTQLWHLILTQGVLYAIGGSLLYSPAAIYLDQWFVKRKGLAFGVMWAGVGASGLIFPFLLTALLNRYGFRTTLRVWGLVLLGLCTPLIYFVKPRLPASSMVPSPRSYGALASRKFVFLQLANMLESLGFFLPSIYLPTYAASLSLRPVDSTIVLAMLNLFSLFSTITLGHATDRWPVNHVIAVSSIGTVLSVLLLWGFGSNLPTLITFAATYGLFAGGFSAIWAGMAKEVRVKNGPGLSINLLMGFFSAGRGVGAVLSGPVSELLLKKRLWEGSYGAYGGDYGALIVFTGISAFCGLVCFGARKKD